MGGTDKEELTMVQISKEGRAILKGIAARLRMKMPEAADLIVRTWEEKQRVTATEGEKK
jgi:hypothetical protein